MPTPRFGTGDAVAGPGAYLASGESQFATGATFTIDNGNTAFTAQTDRAGGLVLQVERSGGRSLAHDELPLDHVRLGDQFGEHRRGGRMDVAPAMGREGGLIGVDL
jgi:hypothetical protein